MLLGETTACIGPKVLDSSILLPAMLRGNLPRPKRISVRRAYDVYLAALYPIDLVTQADSAAHPQGEQQVACVSGGCGLHPKGENSILP